MIGQVSRRETLPQFHSICCPVLRLVQRRIVGSPARFWSAPVFWRFSYGGEPTKSARGLAQSKTLPRGPQVHDPYAFQKDMAAFHEPYEFRIRALIESGGGPPHSKTLPR